MSNSRSRPARLVRRLATFRRVTVQVYEQVEAVRVEAPVEVRSVTEHTVEDARSMDGPARIAEFREFLGRGDRGAYAYRDGVVVSRGWSTRGPRTLDLWQGLGRLFIPPDIAYLHYCETAPAARGLHAYPAVLSRLSFDARGEGCDAVWISTTEDNEASLRGIARAGFRPHRRFRILVLAGFGFQREDTDPGTRPA